MNFGDLKTSMQEIILLEYAGRVIDDEDLLRDLNEIYGDIIDTFIYVYSEIIGYNEEDFETILRHISETDGVATKLVKDNEFVDIFTSLLEEPSQDDFYGTEGWQHYLGLD